MQTVLVIIHLLIVLALIGVVLLQRSEGGLGLGGGGGGGVSGFMTGRGQANALTRTTAILAGLFFITSLALSVMASYNRAPSSILDRAPATPAGQPAPAGQGPGILEQLQRQQGDQSNAPAGGSAGAPAAPAAPAIPFQAPGGSTAPQIPQVPQSQ